MENNGELDSSGFIIVRKDLGLGNKSSEMKNRNPKKHPELKLWICDLLTISKGPEKEHFEFYTFRGLSVNIVNIYGIVTEVVTNRFGVLYKVDDGTGCIGCWHDSRKILQKETLEHRLNRVMSGILENKSDPDENNTSIFLDPNDSAAQLKPELTQAAEWFASRIRDYTDTKNSTLFVLGDTVNLRGKLVDFREERCIRIYNIQLVKNINEETDRRYEIIHLYETCYSKQKSR